MERCKDLKKNDPEEFYTVADLSNVETLKDKLVEWQFYHTWYRPHGSLGGKTPYQFSYKGTSLQEKVREEYCEDKEHIQEDVYLYELELQRLKRSL